MLRRMTAPLAILMAMAAPAMADERLEQAYAAQGRLIVTQFVSAPFSHPARTGGHNYQDKLSHNDVVENRNEFALLLQTSVLDDLKPRAAP